MKEDDSNWFSKWEEELPSPDELMPLSQTLITPDLAFAFHITNPITAINNNSHPPQPPPPPPPVTYPSSADFGDSGGDEPARTLKRPRLVWTPQLHKRFVDAVAHLGIKNAVPKTIMQLMSVDGLTRENVASHLQKYRLYLKRMQGISTGTGGGASGGLASVVSDPATDHLFASSPVPPHFLHPAAARATSDHFLPFVPVGALQHHHHQMAAAAAAAQYHHRQVAHFGSPQNGQFEHPFLARPVHRIGAPVNTPATNYGADLDPGNGTGGRKVLTLFPTGND